LRCRKLGHLRRDAQIVGGHDHARDARRERGAPVDVFDHGATVNVRERLAGETCGGESSGNDGDDFERRLGIDREASRCRVHDES
jgi:hypothetical protein